MKKLNNKWLGNNSSLKILALLLAAICWLAVAMSKSVVVQRINNVPVNIQLQEEALDQLGLNIIDIDTLHVTAVVEGDRAAVGQLKPDQLTATIQLSSNYTEAGTTYEMKIIPAPTTTTSVGVQGKSYEIKKYEPDTVQVKLDHLQQKTLPVEAEISGKIVVAEGFIRDTNETITPSKITITGPEAEVEKVARSVVKLEKDYTLEKTLAVGELPIILLDAEGKEIDPNSHHITLDSKEAQFVLTVLKEKELPLEVEFLAPRNFPVDELNYSISNNDIVVAGPADLISKHKEISLGYIDLSQITMENNRFTFDIELPKGFRNLENIRSVTVEIPNENWAEDTFTVDNIRLQNIPNDLDIELVTDSVYNVHMIGDKEVMKNLKATDLVAEIDLSEKKELTLGQYQFPVKISAPTKGLVWASGEYSVVIKVKQPSK